MGMSEQSRETQASGTSVFERILVGVDGSPEGLQAARQAALLLEPGGRLDLVAAWSLELPVAAPLTLVGPAADDDAEAARTTAAAALREAEQAVAASSATVVKGFAAHALLEEIGRSEATLVAVGSHGRGRLAGAFAGSTATELVHRAPCSVLVGRGERDWAPRRIAVGVDGSAGSARAYAAAQALAERHGADLTVVTAEGGKLVDIAAVSLVAGDGVHVTQGDPVDVLAAAAAEADLLVLGSRGLHGVRAIGSVAERVAHRARCSTLIVRGG